MKNKAKTNALLKKSLYSYAKRLPFLFSQQKLRILMYHGIDDLDFPVSTFDSHLQFFKRHFETFNAREIPGLMERNCKTASGKPPLVLTFDDGLKNNAQFVAPLLEKYDLKATFYVISGLLEGGQMMWNHELICRLLLMSTDQRREISTSLTAAPAVNPEQDSHLIHQVRAFVNQVKRWPADKKQALMQRLQSQLPNPDYSDEMRTRFEIMSDEDIKALPSGIEIGSHTVSHAILDTVSSEVGIAEITDSKRQLETLLDRPVSSFCYPNGNYTPETAEAVKQHYDTAMTTEEGFSYPGTPLNRLSRISTRILPEDLCARLIWPN